MKPFARRWVLAGVWVAIAGALVWNAVRPRRFWPRAARTYTVIDRVAQFAARVDARLAPVFEARSQAYPPTEISLVAFKATRQLELYARASKHTPWCYIKSYAVQGASGALGSKFKEGDRQVPEGVYAVEFLHPNSRFHVSLKLNYPNDFEQRMGVADGRSDLGSDIMIHGGSSSIGCLAMGDEAIEALYVLAACVGPEQIRVMICPTDFRRDGDIALPTQPPWTDTLYAELQAELALYNRGA